MFFKHDDEPQEPLLNHIIESKDTIRLAAASINLTQIGNGRYAKVIELRGGHRFAGKLEAMGIVPGAMIRKKSAALMKGPIIIEKGETQFAIGYAMAQKIMVEPIDKD